MLNFISMKSQTIYIQQKKEKEKIIMHSFRGCNLNIRIANLKLDGIPLFKQEL